MADNWSPSVVTLTNRGDWAKWSFTIPDAATRDDFNGNPGDFSRLMIAVRSALSAASREAFLVVMVNDIIAKIMKFSAVDTTSSSASWISADRFYFDLLTNTGGGFATVDPAIGSHIVLLSPFVVGTNTIRLLSLGRASDFAAEPCEIDFVYVDTGATPTEALFNATKFNGPGDDHTAETAPALFATHVNGNPFGASDDHGWILKAPDATTGTAAIPTFELVKNCPSGGGNVTAKLRVTDGGGGPVAGTVGVQDISVGGTQTATLDGNGEAMFIFPALSDVVFWYGGNDAWQPQAIQIDDGFRIGCYGWKVGAIGR